MTLSIQIVAYRPILVGGPLTKYYVPNKLNVNHTTYFLFKKNIMFV